MDVTVKGFMDETGHSGDQTQRFNGIAGLIAPCSHWDTFERKWKKTLKDFKIPYFHMREFQHSELANKSTKSKNVFKDWSTIKKERLLSRLLKIIETVHALPVGSIMLMEDFRSLSDTQRNIFNDPYHLSFACVLEYVAFFLEREGAGDAVKADLIFSDQVEFRHKALQYYENANPQDPLLKQRISPPIFCDMRKFVGLQAADLVAYEFYKECERQHYRRNDKPRDGYQVLIKMTNRLKTQILLRFQSTRELRDLANSAERHHRRLSYWANRKNNKNQGLGNMSVDGTCR